MVIPMKYKQIRYTTPFMSEAAVKKAMEKAKAFNVMGIGKWKIEERDGSFDLLFIPGFGLRIALNRAPVMWHQMATQTQKAFQEELNNKTIMAIAE